jgi:hypothetical protein
MTNPKDIHSIQELQDCNPTPTPRIDGYDMSDMQADKDMTNLENLPINPRKLPVLR